MHSCCAACLIFSPMRIYRETHPILLNGAKPPRLDEAPDSETLSYSCRGFKILLSTSTKMQSSSAAETVTPPENFLCPEASVTRGCAGSPPVKKQQSGPRTSFALQYVSVSSISKTVSFDFDVPRGEQYLPSLVFFSTLDPILSHRISRQIS